MYQRMYSFCTGSRALTVYQGTQIHALLIDKYSQIYIIEHAPDTRAPRGCRAAAMLRDITDINEEKILSNMDKVQKLINPNSKKQIVQLEEDAFFKDLIESIKTYFFCVLFKLICCIFN